MLLGFVFSSCKDSGGDDDGEIGVEFGARLQTVWQDDESATENDEIGIYFTKTKIFFWDYDGDEFDEGDDCYFVAEVASLVFFEEDIYTLSFIDPETQEEMEVKAKITIVDGKLVFSDEEGQDAITYTNTQNSSENLNPKCRSEAKTKKTLKPAHIF